MTRGCCWHHETVKLCYVDETGTDGQSRLVVMVGIVADSRRLHRTQTDFADTFARLGEGTVKELRELKSVELYRGHGPWKGVDGPDRAAIIGDLCAWLCERKQDIALAAIDVERFREDSLHEDLDHWMTAALHIALQVQRAHQGLKKRKGSTFLIFDEHQRHADRLAELLFDPPEWTDAYYGRSKHQERLDQVIDTAFYARSHHVGFVQVADLFAFLFRRYAELHDYGVPPAYEDEVERIDGWVERICQPAARATAPLAEEAEGPRVIVVLSPCTSFSRRAGLAPAGAGGPAPERRKRARTGPSTNGERPMVS